MMAKLTPQIELIHHAHVILNHWLPVDPSTTFDHQLVAPASSQMGPRMVRPQELSNL